MSGPVCRVCSAENHDGAKFCSACGAALAAPKKQGDPLLGTTLAGKFQIEKLLGNGAMGRVYQATHLALQRGVAIKVMHDHLARSGEFATRFVREARAASQLDHPNSIRVLDFGKADQADGALLYLVMELFPGTDLYELLRQETALDIPRAAKIVTQILTALEDAHAIGLIHRDLKPENVLVGKRLDGTEIAKICDFGIAKIAQQEGPKLSQVGTMIGTPLYMSPEAAMGRDTDARSDLYSVGVILYEVMTGTRPFDAPSPLEVARMQVEDPPQPPSQRAPNRNLTPAIERVILKSLAKAPKDRHQSARELREALEAALRGGAPAVAGAATVACKSCGAQIAPETRFCAVCGAPRTSSANKMAAVNARSASSQGSQPGVERAFSGLSGLVPDSLLGDIRRASTEAKADRRTLAVLVLDLVGTDDGGDPDELATRIGDRFEIVERVLTRFGAILQGAGGTRVTAYFGVDAGANETEALVARAVEAAFAVKKEGANPRWLKGGVASGIFRISSSAGGAQFLGAAAQQAARATDQARSLEFLVDESIRGRVGEGFTAAPSRAGFFLVREDFSSLGTASVIRPLVGRDAEVEQLVSAARTAMKGQGQVIAIRGDAGIGKTALIREAISRLRDVPIRWYRVACRPTGATALGALRDLILTYTGVGRGASADAVRSSLSGDHGSLAGLGLAPADQQQLVGLLLGGTVSTSVKSRTASTTGSSGSTITGSPMLAPDVMAREGSAAIRNFLAAALKRGDVGFVVEDLQWIDPQSATLLAQLASAIGKRSALLVLSARGTLWSEWTAPHFKRLDLGPLLPQATGKLLAMMLPDGEVPPDIQQSILQRAGGNPLFLESIVEALRAQGSLKVEAGRYVLSKDAKLVATGLRGLVEARLRALDEDGQRVLLLMSVGGSEVELADLQELVGSGVDLEPSIADLIGRGLLEERGRVEGGSRRVGFANDGVREVLYEMVPLADRKVIHAALATRWEAIRAATKESPVPLEEIARHWELAGEAGPASARLEEAAASLTQRGDFRQAALLLKRAYAFVAALDVMSASRIIVAYADALAQVGDLAGIDAALKAHTQLKLEPQARAAAEARGERSRALAHRRSGRAAEAAGLAQTALDRAVQAKDRELACDLHLDLSGAFEESGDTHRALQAALTGLELATTLADKGGTLDERGLRARLATYLNAIGRLYLRRDDAVRANEYFRNSLAQAEKINDASAASRALANLGNIAARRNDFRAASAETSRALRLAQAAGDRMAQAQIFFNLGSYLQQLGKRDEAEESFRAAQALAEALGWAAGVASAEQALAAVGVMPPAK